jgi:ribosome-binding factor A
MTRRTERIAEQLREEVSRVLRTDVGDPRVRLVTLTRVDVAPDLSHALIWWSYLDPRGASAERASAEAEAGLAAAAGFVRRQLAHCLELRRVPELRFRRDPSIELGSRTLTLLREIGAQAAHPAGATEEEVDRDAGESREQAASDRDEGSISADEVESLPRNRSRRKVKR